MEESLLTLLADPDIEERLIDWLLARDGVPGFTTFPAHGHGTSQPRMSLAEQVAGRRARVAFLLVLPLDDARALVDALAASLAGAGIHYWIQPVTASGPVARRAASAEATPAGGDGEKRRA